MATKYHSILGSPNDIPDPTAGAFWERLTATFGSAIWEGLVLNFADTSTDIQYFGQFKVPDTYAGSAQIRPIWTANANSGNVRWKFNYRALSPLTVETENYDQASWQETVEANDAAPATAGDLLAGSITGLTAGNFVAADVVQYMVEREGSDTGNDTMAAAALMAGLFFQFSDT